MTDLATMQARILTELKRPHLTAEVTDAIDSAISHYNQEAGFYFQHERAEMTLSTSSSSSSTVRLYALPSDFAFPFGSDAMQLKAFDAWDRVEHVSWRQLEDDDLETSAGATGVPYEWSYYDQQFRFYPVVPAGTAYVARLNYIKTVANTGSDWYNAAERMIRFRAKWDLYTNIIQQFDKADRMRLQMEEAENAVRRLGARRSATGRIKPYY